MTPRTEVVYRGASAAAGPLLFLERTRRVALGESVIVRQPGQVDRRGQVIDAGERVTVIQLLDTTVGLAPDRAEVVLTGESATAVVGRELLGRALDGHGVPVDGLPVPVGDTLRPRPDTLRPRPDTMRPKPDTTRPRPDTMRPPPRDTLVKN